MEPFPPDLIKAFAENKLDTVLGNIFHISSLRYGTVLFSNKG